jgi:hypothetical protein
MTPIDLKFERIIDTLKALTDEVSVISGDYTHFDETLQAINTILGEIKSSTKDTEEVSSGVAINSSSNEIELKYSDIRGKRLSLVLDNFTSRPTLHFDISKIISNASMSISKESEEVVGIIIK